MCFSARLTVVLRCSIVSLYAFFYCSLLVNTFDVGIRAFVLGGQVSEHDSELKSDTSIGIDIYIMSL